jgi:hypothetical protein
VVPSTADTLARSTARTIKELREFKRAQQPVRAVAQQGEQAPSVPRITSRRE